MSKTRIKAPFVVAEKITVKNKSIPRNKSIRRNTPHCVAGNATAEQIINLSHFHDGKTASTTYGIGGDGRIGINVEETNRSWCTSSAINDNEAITFEIANCGGAPDWRMTDEAINSYLDASVEIAKFYGYKKINYQEKPANITGSVNVENWIKTWANPDEMIITLHNWYANKACPGPYLMRQLPWLVREMNKRLQDPNWIPESFVGEGSSPAMLSKGAKGEEVKLAQHRLNAHGISLNVDGDFGTKTEEAVVSFQKDKKLTTDGVIGPNTWIELNKQPVAQPASTPKPKDTTPKDPKKQGAEYRIRIKVSALNVRSGPGTSNAVVTALVNDNNVYTIIEEADGAGASKWGKLKSGIGWVSLDHVTKI